MARKKKTATARQREKFRSSQREAESTPHKGTPPQSYIDARNRLLGDTKDPEKRKPWNFSNHMTLTDPEHWVTRDGRKIAVSRMEDTHVVNTVRLLRRAAPRARLAEAFSQLAGPRPNGDMATLAFQQDLEELAMMGDDEFLASFCPPFRALLSRYSECERRIDETERAFLNEAIDDSWGGS